MTDAERHLMTVFSAALDRESAAERAAYLDEACKDDAGFRERVEALLRAHEQAGGFLEPRGTGPYEPSLTARTAEDAIGGTVIAARYKLIEEIGEGGMGTVWMAQQTEPVKRAVAVKLIKAGMDSKQVLARFEAERQALALMDHPNIARVLDAGATDGGRPFFVMELVKGVPITKYCDEHHLTPRQRLELFVPVCQAVQHAHQKGVIHRDIKPSNVLVAQYDGRPVPKVIDFGVAKAAGQQLTDKTLMTGFGAVVGTLEYMSPEQAELNQLDIDTRSDIYSLGVVLYELLTGSTPLDRKRLKQAAFAELLRIIREEEPPKPSTRLSDSTDSLPSVSARRHMEPAKLTKLVRGELDWIVMKALDKDRNRRYETANGFAMDVQRYLADEPVQACPPSVGYRLRKLARRNRAATAVAAAFILLLGAGAAVSTYFALAASASAKESAANAAASDRNARAARKNLNKAQAAVDRMLFRVAEEKLADTPQMATLRTKLLEDATRFEEELVADAGDDPALRRDAAIARAHLGFVYLLLSRGDEAEANGRRAVALLEEVVRDSPEDRAVAWQLAFYRVYFYYALRDRNEPARAEEQVRASVDLAERLRRESPGDADLKTLTLAYVHLGEAHFLAGRLEEAEPWLRKGIALAREQGFAHLEGSTLHLFGRVLEAQRRLPEARAALEQAITALDRSADAERDSRILLNDKAWTLNDLSRLVRDAGEVDRANAMLVESATLYERLADRFPEFRIQLTNPIMLQRDLGRFLDQRDRDAADAWYGRAADRAAKLARSRPGEGEYLRLAFETQAERIRARRAAGRGADAKAALRELAAFLDSRSADPICATELPGDLAAVQADLAALATELGEGDLAARARRGVAANLERLERLVERYPSKADYREHLALGYGHLAGALNESKRPEEAEEAMSKAISLFEKLGADFPADGRYREQQGHHLWRLGAIRSTRSRTDEAEQAYRRAATVFDKLASDFPKEPFWQQELGYTYYALLGPLLEKTKRTQGAEQAYRKAVAVHEKLVTETGNIDYAARLGTSYELLVSLLKAGGKAQEAEDVRRQAIGFFEKRATANPKEPLYQLQVGQLYIQFGELDKAAATYTKVLEQNPDNAEALKKRGWLNLTAQSWDKAVADYTEAIKRKRDDWEAWSGRGYSHMGLRQWDKAIADFSEAIRLAPDVHSNWHHRGLAYYELGQWDKVDDNCGELLRRYPNDFNALHLRAVACTKLKQPDKAVADLRQAFAKGFTDLDGVKRDERFAPLRDREDFKTLLAEQEAKSKK